MSHDQVNLTYGVNGKHTIHLKPLTGVDERDAGSNVHALLKCLAIPGEGLVFGDEIDHIPLCDRDQSLAVLYRILFGDNVIAETKCTECDSKFELRFLMSDLSKSRLPENVGCEASIELDGESMRLPSMADVDVANNTLVSLLTRLRSSASVEQWSESQVENASTELEKANPILDLDMEGSCPECSALNLIHFSIVKFMNTLLSQESGFLMRELHLLATSYGWSFNTLLSLTQIERREFVRMVLADRHSSVQKRKIA